MLNRQKLTAIEAIGIPLKEVDSKVTENTFCVITRRFGEIYIHRYNSWRTLYLFQPYNPVRRAAIAFTTHEIYDILIMAVVLISVAELVVPQSVPLLYVRITFLFYITEVLYQSLSRGFIFGSYSYLRNPWMCLDFAITLLRFLKFSNYIYSLPDLGPSSSKQFGIQSLRGIRAIHLISKIPGIQVMAKGVLLSVSKMYGVTMIVFLFLLSISLAAKQLFMGLFHQKCVKEFLSNSTVSYNNHINNPENWLEGYHEEPIMCGNISGSQRCSNGYVCLPDIGGTPDANYTNFDNFSNSILNTFRLLTQDEWEDVYDKLIEATGPICILFFLPVIFLGSFFLFNLMLVVVTSSYDTVTSEGEAANQNLSSYRYHSSFQFEINKLCLHPLQTDEETLKHVLKERDDIIYHHEAIANRWRKLRKRIYQTEHSQPSYKIKLMKVQKSWRALRKVTRVILGSLRNIFRLLIVMAVLICTFAIIGNRVLGKFYDNQNIDRSELPNIAFRWTFATFGDSAFVVFQLFTGEWIKHFWSCMLTSNDSFLCPLVIISYYLIGCLVVLNLFTALLLSSFDSSQFKSSISIRETIAQALVLSFPAILRVVLVVLFIWLPFAIYGVTHFHGKFSRCEDESHEVIAEIVNKTDCIQKNFSWEESFYNFNHLGESYLLLFQLAMYTGWTEMVEMTVDYRENDLQPQRDSQPQNYAYVIIFIFVGGFFSLNLFVAVAVDTFTIMQKEVESGISNLLLTDAQKKYYKALLKLMNRKPVVLIKSPSNKCLYAFYTLVYNIWFRIFIVFLIGKYSFIFFTYLYYLSLFLGQITYGFPQSTRFSFLYAFRLLRVLHLLRLAQFLKDLRRLIYAILASIPSLFNISIFLFLLIFVYAIIGMAYFAHIKLHATLSSTQNFQSFIPSILILFRLTTGQGWDHILRTLSAMPPECEMVKGECGHKALAIVFILSFILTSSILFVNLFIAVILDNYREVLAQEKDPITEDDLKNFYDVWKLFDPKATQFISIEQLSDLLNLLDRNLRIAQPNQIAIAFMNLPLTAARKVHCLSILKGILLVKFGDVDETIIFQKLRAELQRKYEQMFPELKGSRFVETTMELKRRDYAARVIQARVRKMTFPMEERKQRYNKYLSKSKNKH
ncbi:sodium channel protein 60E-like [Uloborus diversus]|uniref:sodium channel protein 60E-like n=1 Tax=Uloborus diversus TaxID=327109 RepID=UPI00240A8B15|nr:sodium channel protein 60E-like [Uloborus diversus]